MKSRIHIICSLPTKKRARTARLCSLVNKALALCSLAYIFSCSSVPFSLLEENVFYQDLTKKCVVVGMEYHNSGERS